MARYMITHSLLSSWLYMLDDEYSDDPMSEFMLVLNREPTPTSEPMQNGIDFENLVTSIIEGEKAHQTVTVNQGEVGVYDHPWFAAASKIADRCRGGILQYKASRRITVGETDLLLYGRLDCLRSGEIIDIKFSKRYERGKYEDSTQHPVYMELIPEAEKFTYLVSNGSEVWSEQYRRDEVRSIYPVIGDFLSWLERMGLDGIYKEKWETRW